MASSQEQHYDHYYNTTAAPPPTPSSEPNIISTTAAAADTLSQLLNRLPPTLSLSLPKRRQTPLFTTTTITPPIISLSDSPPKLLSAFQLGLFQLTDNTIPSQLAHSAESDSLSFLHLPRDQKQLHFPRNWPLDYDEDENKTSDSFCFDSSCFSDSAELKLTSLRDFTREMEKVGLQIIEAMSCALGFENPAREDPTRICSLLWVSDESHGNKQVMSGKMYPYVVGLQYQTRAQKIRMLADSGWISVLTQEESILVSIGDIAQVWSNGKLKKVRGRPVPGLEEGNNSTKCISMTLLLTLPVDSTVSILIPESIDSENGDDDDGNISKNKRLFNSFSFEDYAWRMHHWQHGLKDPLDRYRA